MSRPILFLFILISLVLFLLGVRIGKEVEKTDKTYVPNISPSPKVKSTVIPLSYLSHKLETCNMSFPLADVFKETSISSDEARFSYGIQKVIISCKPETVSDYKKVFSSKSVTRTEIINSVKTNIYETAEGVGYAVRKSGSPETILSFPSPFLPLFIDN